MSGPYSPLNPHPDRHQLPIIALNVMTHVRAGLFDPVKETDRLRKQEAKVQKALAGLQGRLANRSFLDNAAPAVVQEVRQQQVGVKPYTEP